MEFNVVPVTLEPLALKHAQGLYSLVLWLRRKSTFWPCPKPHTPTPQYIPTQVQSDRPLLLKTTLSKRTQAATPRSLLSPQFLPAVVS